MLFAYVNLCCGTHVISLGADTGFHEGMSAELRGSGTSTCDSAKFPKKNKKNNNKNCMKLRDDASAFPEVKFNT